MEWNSFCLNKTFCLLLACLSQLATPIDDRTSSILSIQCKQIDWLISLSKCNNLWWDFNLFTMPSHFGLRREEAISYFKYAPEISNDSKGWDEYHTDNIWYLYAFILILILSRKLKSYRLILRTVNVSYNNNYNDLVTSKPPTTSAWDKRKRTHNKQCQQNT